MSNPKGKTVPDTLAAYLIMLVLYCFDIFVFESDRSVLGDAFFSRIAGLLVLFFYIWITKDSLATLGITKKKKKFAAGAVYGTLFSVVPLFIVIAVEAVILGVSNINSLDLRFAPPSLNFVRDIENLTPATAVLIYVFTSFVGSVFKEFTFRGYILKKLKSVMDFKSANILQALLYMFMTMPMLLRNKVLGYYDQTTSSLIIFIIFFYVIHETIAGIKWGLLTRVSGSTYVAVVDHFLLVFLSNSIYITNRYVTWSFMTHMLAIQVISFVMVFIYYKKNMKKLAEKRAKEKEESEKRKKEHDARRKNREQNDIIDKNIEKINEISPDQYKTIVNEANESRHSHHRHHHRSTEQNKKHSAENERLIESIPTAEASKAASRYLESRMNSGTHSHSRHGTHSSHRGREIEDFSADNIAKKTEDYSDSLSLERSNPKHPHPHDTIARDSRLSAEELDAANSDKIDSFEDSDIDSFLRSFNEEMSKPSRRHRRSEHEQSISDESADENSDSFDVDRFLRDFQSKEEARGSSSGSSHHHHHHHHRHSHPRDEDVVSITEVSADNFFDEYQKTVDDKKEKQKQSFLSKVRDLGMLDDSDSNDLI